MAVAPTATTAPRRSSRPYSAPRNSASSATAASRLSATATAPAGSGGAGPASSAAAATAASPATRPAARAWSGAVTASPVHLERRLGEHPGVERLVVGGHELDLDEMGAKGQLRQLLGQLVVHGDQLAVQHHVHMPLVGPDPGGGRRDDLGAGELKPERQIGAFDDLAVVGRVDGDPAGGAGPVGGRGAAARRPAGAGLAGG